jgi:hypothetical protein
MDSPSADSRSGRARASAENACEFTAQLLPKDKPRYLMGVGTPLDLLEGVHRGVDMFDCIMPTQLAQRGAVFTSRGFLQMRRGVYKFSEEKLDPACACPTCARYSRAYLHHLTKTGETLGWQLLGKHNIHFYHQLMREIRESILADSFLDLYREKRAFLHESDLDNPIRAQKAQAHETAPAGKLRSAHGLGRLCQHPPDFVRRDHAFAHAADGGSAKTLHRAIKSRRARSSLRAENAENVAPLVIWDVGLGAAANAMAAILCYEEQAAKGPCVRCKSSVSKTTSIRFGSPSGITAIFLTCVTAVRREFCRRASGNRGAIRACGGCFCLAIFSKPCLRRPLRRILSFTTCSRPKLPVTNGRSTPFVSCSKLAAAGPPNFSPIPAQLRTARRSWRPAFTLPRTQCR